MKKMISLSLALVATVSFGACSSSSPKLSSVTTTKAGDASASSTSADSGGSTTTAAAPSGDGVASAEKIKMFRSVLVPMLAQQGYTDAESTCLIDKVFGDPVFLKAITGGGAAAVGADFAKSMETTVLKCVSAERLAEISAKKG